MDQYVAYYRVSTNRQEYGIDVQKNWVAQFITSRNAEVLATFTEKESGKINSRPQLLKAIAFAKEHSAKLLIAKLDRLSRNASFIMTLRDTGVNFICCDMPEANTLTIGIMAVMAQDERERIAKRTKEALAELKKKGVKLGNPKNLTDRSRVKAIAAIKRNAKLNINNQRATGYIRSLRKEGMSYVKMAAQLNSQGFTTSRNNQFSAIQVYRLARETIELLND